VVDWDGGAIVNIQKELMSLNCDALAMVVRVNQFGTWGDHFNTRYPSYSRIARVLKMGVAAMLFYESEFANISRKAAKISERASEIRS